MGLNRNQPFLNGMRYTQQYCQQQVCLKIERQNKGVKILKSKFPQQNMQYLPVNVYIDVENHQFIDYFPINTFMSKVFSHYIKHPYLQGIFP